MKLFRMLIIGLILVAVVLRISAADNGSENENSTDDKSSKSGCSGQAAHSGGYLA